MEKQYCELTAFLKFWAETRTLAIPAPDEMPLDFADKLSGIVLFREGRYQVQLFILQPNTIIMPHVHPNVDSYEVYMGGDLLFEVDGVVHEQIEMFENIRVHPHSVHSGIAGARAAFLSVQLWLNGTQPTTVGYDWADDYGNEIGTASAMVGAAERRFKCSLMEVSNGLNIWNVLGSTPIATSAMKGSKYAEEHPDDPAGGYGGPGIVGTILKMYLGGAVGGALGGAAGGGASGMTGAANGISGVTSGMSGGLGGLGGMGEAAAGTGSAGGFGGALDLFNGAGGGFGGEAAGSGMMGGIGDMAQKAIGNAGGGGGGQGSGEAGKKAQAEEPDPNSLENMMSRMQNMAGNAQKNQTGLMSIPGIPDYFKQQMQGWQ